MFTFDRNECSRSTETSVHDRPKYAFWRAREIQAVLGYTEWRNFDEVISKARNACAASGVPTEKHFVDVTKMVEIGSTAVREQSDWILSRYACYLIAMNGDSRKAVVGYAQSYFAIQARRQEVQDQLTADERRLLLRSRVKEANKSLASTAKRAGVQRFPVFQDAGYKGMYDGLGQADVKQLKGIPPKEKLLDCIDRTELAAHEFRITQTDQKLVREHVDSEPAAVRMHHDVGHEVRMAIQKIGGTMPENLPAAQPIKKMIAKRKKQLRVARKELT